MATKPNPYANVMHLMDPELRAIIEKQRHGKLVAPNKSNIHMLRKGFDLMTARWHQSPVITQTLRKCRERAPWIESIIKIPARDGYQMLAKVYKPSAQGEQMPLMVLVHGGTACMGDVQTEEFIAQLLCSRSRLVVVNIEYRLHPEFPAPTAVTDTYDAMSWLQQYAEDDGGDLHDVDLAKGFVACGVSAGGNLVTGALILAAENLAKAQADNTVVSDGVPRVSGAIMMMTGYPAEMSDSKHGTSINLYPDRRPSWTELEDAPITNKKTIPNWAGLADNTDIFSPLFSALHVSTDSPILDHMPQFWYHQHAGLDMWQDTALLWLSILLHGKADLLPKQSVEHIPSISGRPRVKLTHYPGLPHCWWMVWPQLSRTRQWIEDLVNGADWALGRRTLLDEATETRNVESAKL